MKYSEFLNTLSRAYTSFVQSGLGNEDQAYLCVVLSDPFTSPEVYITRYFESQTNEPIGNYWDFCVTLQESIHKSQLNSGKSFAHHLSHGLERGTEAYFVQVNLGRAKWLKGLAMCEEALGN